MSIDFDLICLSHLRWDFVYQRPHHLMSRFARQRRVFFFEFFEPFPRADELCLSARREESGVLVASAHLPPDLPADRVVEAERTVLDELMDREQIRRYVLWYYTPLPMAFTQHLSPEAVVYDSMDELSAFADAPPELPRYEDQLFRRADLVFTGGESLYQAKRARHPSVYMFPSSVDARHFARAREPQPEPPDQHPIPHPRLGFYGVIDERMDLDLLAGIADRRPRWQLVMVGPMADWKFAPETLPRRGNIHYLGGKSYEELPAYLAGWDVAILPFARNESTRYISPTKTPEYLAGGRPVVSTSIRDVVRPYGEQGLVRIADTPDGFVAAVEAALKEDGAPRMRRVDALLERMSWDRTWQQMDDLLRGVVDAKGRDEASFERGRHEHGTGPAHHHVGR